MQIWTHYLFAILKPKSLEFFLQFTRRIPIVTPSDMEGKSLGEIPNDLGWWLGDILGRFNIGICSLYLFKFTYVTFYGTLYNICKKSVSILNYVIDAPGFDKILDYKTCPWIAMVLHSVTLL